jgi:hypothetical protein
VPIAKVAEGVSLFMGIVDVENYTTTRAVRRRRTHPQVRCSVAIMTMGLQIGAWTIVPSIVGAQATETTASSAVRTDLEALRQELETLKHEYETRIAELERRLAALSPASDTSPEPPPAQPAAPAPPAPAAQATLPPASSSPLEPGVPPVPSSKVFNPDVAVVGNVLGAAGTNSIENSPALQLEEAEASFQAVIDPYARGDFFIAVGPEGAELEEGFITFTSLPGGLLVKAGKLRGQFGKVNAMHTHALSWTDRPLVTRNLVGGDEGISDGGVSVSKLIPNRLLFLEATGEVFGGRSDVFAGSDRSQMSYIGRLRGYRDLTEGTNIDLGTSFAFGYTDVEPDATRRLFGVDATLRYRPLRRAIYRRFLARTELVWNQDRLESTRPTVFGMYASGEYQFARRWFAGGRYDYSQRPLDSSLVDTGGAATLTFWPSEFSQVRGQYRRTNYAEGVTANEFLFQFLFSIGAHGAHVF